MICPIVRVPKPLPVGKDSVIVRVPKPLPVGKDSVIVRVPKPILDKLGNPNRLKFLITRGKIVVESEKDKVERKK